MLSNNYSMWKSIPDFAKCSRCKHLHGKLYRKKEPIHPKIPLHPACRCKITKINALVAGTATSMGVNGADYWLKHYGQLPSYYISWKKALAGGMESKGWQFTGYIP